MKAYRFPKIAARSGYKCLSILVLVAFLFSSQAVPAQAASNEPEPYSPASQKAPAVPAQPAVTAPAVLVPCTSFYQAGASDSLQGIADSFIITLQELRAANPWLADHPLTAETVLCIPGVNFEHLHAKTRLYAVLILGHLTVYGENFPTKYRYVVRVMANRSGLWTKLGTVRPAKDKTILDYFKLPKKIRYPNKLRVCLKEIDTGWTICTWAKIIHTDYP